jgi:4-amino-4-deoxy-L-arabinose transferase-like glycosyltransferase
MTIRTEAPRPEYQKTWSRTTWLVLLIPAAAKLVLHLLTTQGYGIHGDELYYLACSDHLAWGYVDQPPLSLLLLHLQRAVFGDSLLSIRFLPALAGSLIVLLTGLLARRLGAKAFGQLLAGLCALIAGVYLSMGHIYSMNVFDVLFWLVAFHLIVRIIDGGPPTLWAWLGVVVGLGFENKVSILFLCLGLAVGLSLTRQRQTLRTPWLLIGGGIAALLILPNIIWQATHGWPTLEWMANARSMKNVTFSLPAYLGQQVLLMHPLTVVVWLTGITGLFFDALMAKYRSLGWCYLVVLTAFVIGGGKPYYLSPVYPILFAAGAIVIERRLARTWSRTAMATVFLAGGSSIRPPHASLLHLRPARSWDENWGRAVG